MEWTNSNKETLDIMNLMVELIFVFSLDSLSIKSKNSQLELIWVFLKVKPRQFNELSWFKLYDE